MSRILLISSIYPIPGDGNQGTPVCHYFTREWVGCGHDVRVVHVQAVYPAFFYLMAKLARRLIAAKTGAVVYTGRDKGAEYVMEGVPVLRIPVFKPVPHGPFRRKSVRSAVRRIVSSLETRGFHPDYIIGHFPNPQLEMISLLRETYPQSKTVMVMHGDIELARKVYGERLLDLVRPIDLWGFRNPGVARLFEERIAPVGRQFLCYSGIPEVFTENPIARRFDAGVHRFIYVGELIERKYPEKVLAALLQADPDGFHLTYVGEGHLAAEIRSIAESKGVGGRVELTGKMPRASLIGRYDEADCMVMISRAEAYGLVYLEAMARGCITIASRGEGFDGIIRDGENGFLCEAGNAAELAALVRRINALSPEERRRISENARRTAAGLTDINAAKLYLDAVLALS